VTGVNSNSYIVKLAKNDGSIQDGGSKSNFYLPHMEYEGSFGFVSRKMKKNIADLHVLELWLKNMIGAKKNFRLSRAVAVERKICATPTA
jgi:hypothetical protein